MTKYKLLKDLPTFKAGDIFEIDSDGNLYLIDKKDSRHWCERVMAYHHKTLERFPNILEEWFEKIEDDRYWCIDFTEATVGGVFTTEYDYESEMDRFNDRIGNRFKSKVEAEEAIQKLIALNRLKRHGLKFDSFKLVNNIHSRKLDNIEITATIESPAEFRVSDLKLLFGEVL